MFLNVRFNILNIHTYIHVVPHVEGMIIYFKEKISYLSRLPLTGHLDLNNITNSIASANNRLYLELLDKSKLEIDLTKNIAIEEGSFEKGSFTQGYVTYKYKYNYHRA